MKKFTLLTIMFVSIACLYLRCKETPPETTNGPKPGKRNFVWTVDTIAYPGSFQTTMRDIWGSAPNNVYVVGRNDQTGWGCMYHYDGSRWSAVRLLANQGGTIQQGFGLFAIYGFSTNDIYAVGGYIYQNPNPPPNFLDSSLIIHFDGSRWSEVQLPGRGRQLIGIGTTGSSTLWTGGTYGTSYHSGTPWVAAPSDTMFWFTDFASNESGVYAMSYYPRPGFGEKDFFLRWSDSTWAIADSFTFGIGYPRFGIYALCSIDGTLYSAGYGVFQKEGASWVRRMDSNPETIIGLFGTRPEHIFAVGTTASIYHYNGTDWYKYLVPCGVRRMRSLSLGQMEIGHSFIMENNY